MLDLSGHTFKEACTRLEAGGYRQFATGNWSLVYETPDTGRIIRATPYDPAYLLFARLCSQFPHPNLPTHHSITHLLGHGYLVEMPRYAPGGSAFCHEFAAALKAAMSGEAENDDLAGLARILQRGIAEGEAYIPYFAGVDWNPENVLVDGETPVLVDGFYQGGKTITQRIAQGLPMLIGQTEIESFLQIPFHNPSQRQGVHFLGSRTFFGW